MKWSGDRSRKAIGIFLVLVLALVSTLVAAPSIPRSVPATELRGVWLTNVDSDVLFSTENLKEGLQQLDRLHFNTVYPTVWNDGYTLYPSQVAQRVTGRSVLDVEGLENRDMLAELIEQAHQRGMSAIPWLEFGFMAPAESELAKRHPDWITSRSDGSQVVMQGTHPRVWLNPFHPQVQKLLVDLVAELVSNYDVDGIQFDDHFSLPVELGYDDYTRQLYEMEHDGRSPPEDPRDLAWIRWRADKITQVMARVFAAVKAKRPDAIVSLSPNPQHFAYTEYLQDWFSWERRGFIEELIVQVYRSDIKRFQQELKRPEMRMAMGHIPVAIGILSGLKNRPVPMSQMQQQVQMVREQKLAGVSFFFYETLWNLTPDSAENRRSGLQKLFPQPAARPSILHCWG
ncbi:glycoside hydrolase family 10 protein [Roseofilum casamattae]|uniref:Glycoside hydrolase family 10 protein n=1 Tax=Roseofilum casamattae BLCC-M143 TaxID=3022442 RepID=A0ABT7C1S0_9CYAN|nr:glycoside hydrolase family 10 protein [Roseofilum casamattae BLCC-M143]